MPAAQIDRIVAGARIPSRATRDDLRRELWAHFEDAGTSAEALRDAIRRFGPEAEIVDSLRYVYRWDYRLLYAVKVVVSIAASIGVALAIQLVANLRVRAASDAVHLAPGFPHAVILSAAVVVALIIAREALRPPINWRWMAAGLCVYAGLCALVELAIANSAGAFATAMMYVALGRLGATRHATARWLLTYGSFVAAMALTHARLNVAFGPARTLVASGIMFAVWTLTSAVVTRVDHLFTNVFESAA